MKPTAIPVLYEDNHLLVVVKPEGIPVQADRSGDLDMLTVLKADLKLRHKKPGNVFLGLVHRLDRPVGGVMVFAKTSKSASRLSSQIRARQFGKIYLAAVQGVPEQKRGRLVHWLLKDRNSNTVAIVDGSTPLAKEAVLDYDVAGQNGRDALIRIQLVTGRPHQIRVQMAAIGHPLRGDTKYGAVRQPEGGAIELWADAISLAHPTQQAPMQFAAPPEHRPKWLREFDQTSIRFHS